MRPENNLDALASNESSLLTYGDQRLRQTVSSSETKSIMGGVAVVAGVAAELLLALGIVVPYGN